MTRSPPCCWTKTKDLSLASLARPLEVVHFSIICFSRGWLKTSYSSYVQTFVPIDIHFSVCDFINELSTNTHTFYYINRQPFSQIQHSLM